MILLRRSWSSGSKARSLRRLPSPPVRPDDVPVLIRPAGRISSGEAIAMEATLAELSWQHQEDEFLLPPAAP